MLLDGRDLGLAAQLVHYAGEADAPPADAAPPDAARTLDRGRGRRNECSERKEPSTLEERQTRGIEGGRHFECEIARGGGGRAKQTESGEQTNQ